VLIVLVEATNFVESSATTSAFSNSNICVNKDLFIFKPVLGLANDKTKKKPAKSTISSQKNKENAPKEPLKSNRVLRPRKFDI
jgi:hypothetical protein